jgi:hypothetical protein
MVTSARIWPIQPYIISDVIQQYLGSSEPHALCKDYQLGSNFLQYRLYGGMGSLSSATQAVVSALVGKLSVWQCLEDHIERILGKAGDCLTAAEITLRLNGEFRQGEPNTPAEIEACADKVSNLAREGKKYCHT